MIFFQFTLILRSSPSKTCQVFENFKTFPNVSVLGSELEKNFLENTLLVAEIFRETH